MIPSKYCWWKAIGKKLIDLFLFRAFRSSHVIKQVSAHIDHVLNSTDVFKAMDPSQKRCYLHKGEKTLQYFNDYSEADCVLECAWKLARDHCQCIPWYMSKMYPSDKLCEIYGNRLSMRRTLWLNNNLFHYFAYLNYFKKPLGVLRKL